MIGSAYEHSVRNEIRHCEKRAVTMQCKWKWEWKRRGAAWPRGIGTSSYRMKSEPVLPSLPPPTLQPTAK